MTVNAPAPQPADRAAPAASRQDTGWDIGVITVLAGETLAVTAMLQAAGTCRQQPRDGGAWCREARISAPGASISVAAIQALDQGQRSAVLAYQRLRDLYDPAVVVLTGIAGGISPAVSLGDVVVVTEVIYYDARKEVPGLITRRGQAQPIPARTRHAVNAFFSGHGQPFRATVPGPDAVPRACKALPGPVGTGEAVIADRDSAVRRYVSADKTLAVETEAGGIARAFYEAADTSTAGKGWLAIRGISDHADTAKDDAYHNIAAWHAAAILRQMLPYLKPVPASP